MPSLVIVNTSPLFYLHRLGHLHVLEKLYGEIVVPEAVLAEIEEGEKAGEDIPKIKEVKWIKVKKVKAILIPYLPDLPGNQGSHLCRCPK